FGIVHLGGEEALDHRDLGLFLRRKLLAIAFAIEVYRFAALLDHLLQHFGDQLVVVGLGRGGAQLDVAVPSLSPPFIAPTSAALISSRIIRSPISLHRKEALLAAISPFSQR